MASTAVLALVRAMGIENEVHVGFHGLKGSNRSRKRANARFRPMDDRCRVNCWKGPARRSLRRV